MAGIYLKYEDSFKNVSNVSKKEDGVWGAKSKVTNIYTKVNGSWVAGASESHTYYDFGGWVETTPDPPTGFEINGGANISAETCEYVSIYNSTTNVTTSSTWSISNGSSYASINSGNGVVTILSNANNSSVTIRAEYNDMVATKTVTLTYVSGSSAETTTNTVVDESGNTYATTTTITTKEDGSSKQTTHTSIIDESGNTVGSSESNTTTESDGSYKSQITNYDENGDLTDGSNISGDVSGNVSTQDVEYDDSGNTTVVGYTIDTSSNPDGYKDISNGVNTEFIPFDGSGKGFECHIRFMAKPLEQPDPPIVTDTEDTSNKYLFHLFNAMSAYSPWYGFMFRWSLTNTNYSNGVLVFQAIGSSGSKVNCDICTANTEKANGIFDYTVAYDPNLTKYARSLTLIDNNSSSILVSSAVTFSDNDLDFTIGYAISQAGTKYRISNVKVYDFSISKLEESQSDSYFCKLTLSDGSITNISGNGELTSSVTSAYSSTCINAKVGVLCTSIGNGAFKGFSKMSAIEMETGITSIGSAAFSGCTSLASVNIPTNTTSIGSSAFTNDYNITGITIPNGVTSIGTRAFNGCKGLPEIVVPDSVTSIGTDAFLSCSGATSITIGSGITNIPQGVFSRCTGATSISIGSNVATIGKWCFDYCTSLTSITIPSSVTSIGQCAFENCSSLNAVISNNTTAPTISSDTFSGVSTGGTLTTLSGSSGYDTWMGTSAYYLGYYNWTNNEV